MAKNIANRVPPIFSGMRQDARRIFEAGLAAVDPHRSIQKHCHREGKWLIIGDGRYDLSKIDNNYVIGAGKATAPMAAAMEEILGPRLAGGTITVKYGHGANLSQIGIVEAGHPVPDENGVAGAEKILALASAAGPNDLVIGLISGGGSALLSLPATNITLADKQETTRVLLAGGTTIHEINALRKHLSQIKGGLLSRAAYPAMVVSLILSDVVGDDLDVIASGPTVPDTSTFADCLDIVCKYGLMDQLPQKVVGHLRAGASGRMAETPKSGDRLFDQTVNRIIGSNFEAITAARIAAEDMGYGTIILSSMIEGDTTEVARMHAAIIKEMLKSGHPIAPPACILSGGETTVRLAGSGKGGRNQEFVLAVAMALDGCNHTVVFSAGTDGTDGPTDAAGAVADDRTITRACQVGLAPDRFLANNDSYHFFQPLGDLVITGPTRTNVMDLRIILVR